MSRVYESLKGVVQETLQRGKGPSTPFPSTKDSPGSPIDDKAEEFQRMVSDWIGAFRATVREREAVASSEVQRAEQLLENLKAENTALQAKLANAEELVHVKEASIKDVEQVYKAKIEELENRIARYEHLWAESYVTEAEDAVGSLAIQHVIGDSFAPRGSVKEEPVPAEKVEPEPNGNGSGGRETVPVKFFDRMTTALGHVVGPRAPV